MINRVVLVGRLTKDPELRYTANGVAVTSFTLAVNRPFSNQQGNREADFINIVVWRKQAENVANFLKKGSMAGVDGRMQTRNYENNEGRRIYVTEVVGESVQFLEPKGSSGGQSQSGDQSNYGGYASNPNSNQNQNFGQSTPGNQGGQHNQGNSPQADDDPFAGDGKPIDINDDDLPF
ncbi:single-stranded DNA-binding protein [Salisediminibacterium halotolerans]|uniref:Single-stranded DNA-binding protein n=1 Tax=Salisediminibacterium halotolerans TaxID=517425 RepID=A0A1H9WJ00_9BACI|nr:MULTISPECIES: single-stranded DNA-binding protein [Salisediminibacterium]RLJ69718.1 single-strand binding protein [Actinophytocola xinjiangensis]RPE89776.1 single-strand binding protein [Salisediminibacterium halotolerans]TWG32612.1 single-strand binding protein [Salisediminibacterium halotolerans]SES33814.1 single-strand DNA-binding protein [Salisediminibacterium haloalkalitolerans]GEL07576.1 single-stranded DNA-binding protein 1 [Salisediminibacterium halotolerans]